MERRISYGNLKSSAIDDILENRSIITKNRIEGCKNCEYRYQCFDCRCDTLSSGNIYAKPWYCTYDPKKGEWADPEEFISKVLEED